MKKRWRGLMMVLASILLAGAGQAVEFDFDLNLPAAGYYSNATEVLTSQSYNGATFDVVYTIDSIADGSNSFAYSSGTQLGVGSDSDLSTHYNTVEGDDGEGLSFTHLAISNFVANDSGFDVGDLTNLKFVGLTLNNVGNSKDGISVSFINYATDSVNFTLSDVTSTYTLELTELSNYTSSETNLFIENDSAAAADRWGVVGLIISIDAPTEGNLPPLADAQNISMFPDTTLDITLTGSDPEGSDLTYAVVDFPTNGMLSGATNRWIYTPTSGYEGLDSFTFTVNDGLDDSAPAIILITVTNLLPTANAQSVETWRNTPLEFTLTGNDTDGPSNLTYRVVSPPVNGALSGTAPDLTYTPMDGYAGADSFTFTVNDGLVDSAPATVSILVNNNPPVADPKIVLTQPDTAVAITLTGSDPEGSSLIFSVVSQPLNGVLSGMEPNITYTPINGFSGSDSFTYTANDGEDDSTPATVSILVSANGFNLSFEDLNTALSNNTLNVGGIPAVVTGVSTNGNDYLYSATFMGVDFDGDGFNDTVTFDILVEAWSNGTITNTVASGIIGTNGTAIIGATDAPVTMAANGWGVSSERMYAGETLEFTLMNVNVSLTDDSKIATAVGTGFVQTFLNEIGNANSHQTVIGEGSGLFEVSWNDNSLAVDGFNTGSDPLMISQAENYILNHNKAWCWRVQDVDFGIIVSVAKAGVPDISIGFAGDDLVFSWDGAAAYNVLTNVDLVYGEWGVAIEGALSPVTNAISSAPQVFYKLGDHSED